jgi:raffinose/stachyose/melibiose transport system permease protein
MKKDKLWLYILEVIMIGFALIFLFPIILILYNSFKSFPEIMTDVMALPKKLIFENYIFAWKYLNYSRLFVNNFIVTFVGNLGIILIGSMAAYKLCRTKTKYSWIIFTFCITPMLIPFQTIMVSVLKFVKLLHLSSSIEGLAVQYWGFGAPFAIFIYHGFIKSIPRELDECAQVDGASSFRMFFQIIFPMLKPVTSTLLVINVMWIWNDFLLPLIMVNGSKGTKTLTLAVYTFFGQYTTDWQYAMAGLVMAVLPSILYFLFMQKHIVKGVTTGAVKG